jgi:CTP:phosphocholine cytidylyltransferase-like protein
MEDCLLNGDKKVKHKFYLKENFQYIKTKHSFHLVDPSPWSLVSALGALMLILLNFFCQARWRI